MFAFLVYSFMTLAGGFIVWFAADLMRDFRESIQVPFDGEDRLKALIRRSVVDDD